jgi:hypothetical protein
MNYTSLFGVPSLRGSCEGGGYLMMVRLNSSFDCLSLSGTIVENSILTFSLNFQRQPEFGLNGCFSWIHRQNSLIWYSFVDRMMGEIILIISLVSVCSESLLVNG